MTTLFTTVRKDCHRNIIKRTSQNLIRCWKHFKMLVPATSAWSFIIMMATNDDGKPRFWIDFRILNQKTKADQCPLSKIEEVFNSFVGCIVFTTLQLFSGYWKIKMGESYNEFTKFGTCTGTYQFEVMRLGLMNAPSTFQRMMDPVLENISFTQAYLDDVVVQPKTINEHMAYLQKVFAVIYAH